MKDKKRTKIAKILAILICLSMVLGALIPVIIGA
jgi:hypothetical protein